MYEDDEEDEDVVVNVDNIDPSIIQEFRSRVGKSVGDSLTDHDCLRFLRARKGSMVNAAAMAISNHQWKHSFLPPIPPRNLQFSPNIILAMPDRLSNHPYVHLLAATHHGFDKDGAPIYWERTGLIQSQMDVVMAHFSVDELLQYHIQSQQAMEIRLQYASKIFGREITQAVTVFDMKHLSFTLDSSSIQYTKTVLAVDEANYPERLKTLFMINCPWYFTAIYAMFRPFIDKKTAEKIVILGYDYMDALQEHIDISEIPAELGGEAVHVGWSSNYGDHTGVSERQVVQALTEMFSPDKREALLTEEELAALLQCISLSEGREGGEGGGEVDALVSCDTQTQEK